MLCDLNAPHFVLGNLGKKQQQKTTFKTVHNAKVNYVMTPKYFFSLQLSRDLASDFVHLLSESVGHILYTEHNIMMLVF